MRSRTAIPLVATFVAACVSAVAGHAADGAQVKTAVDAAVRPVMEKHDIPGMAIGVIVAGKSYLFNYGVASKATGKPVTPETIFEVGSITKTFTVTLATYAQASGQLSLSDKIGAHLPSLKDSKIGDVDIFHLGTHTAGGFPLQFPDGVNDTADTMKYFAEWQPTHAQGTHRSYANPSIGLLGVVAAKSMDGNFADLLEQRIFPALGLTRSFINLPKAKEADYAQGYTRKGKPVRMTKGPLFAEAYGLRTTATDLLRFVEANMTMVKIDDTLQKAISDTHAGYFEAEGTIQDLIWEQYPLPVELKTLLKGNSSDMALKTMPVTAIVPPMAPRDDAWINKTGATAGFGGYVAFVPTQKFGIVVLANKNYPNEDRVTIAHRIFTQIEGDGAPRN